MCLQLRHLLESLEQIHWCGSLLGNTGNHLLSLSWVPNMTGWELTPGGKQPAPRSYETCSFFSQRQYFWKAFIQEWQEAQLLVRTRSWSQTSCGERRVAATQPTLLPVPSSSLLGHPLVGSLWLPKRKPVSQSVISDSHPHFQGISTSPFLPRGLL